MEPVVAEFPPRTRPDFSGIPLNCGRVQAIAARPALAREMIVAAQFGLDNWNVLAARIADATGDVTAKAAPSSVGPRPRTRISPPSSRIGRPTRSA